MAIKKLDVFAYPMIFIVGIHGVGKETIITELLTNEKYQNLNLHLLPRYSNKQSKKVKPGFFLIPREEFNLHLKDNNMIVLKSKKQGQMSGVKVSDIIEICSGIEDFLKDNNLLGNKKIKIIMIKPENNNQVLRQIITRDRNSQAEIDNKIITNNDLSKLYEKYADIIVTNKSNKSSKCASEISDIITTHIYQLTYHHDKAPTIENGEKLLVDTCEQEEIDPKLSIIEELIETVQDIVFFG